MRTLDAGDPAALLASLPGVAAFAAARYALVALIALASYAIGRRIVRRVAFHSAWEEASVCTALGLGALAHVVFFLGLARRIDVVSVLVAVAALLAASWRELARAARGALGALRALARPPRAAGRALLLLAALALLVPVFLLPLYPPIAWDAIGYHLPFAKENAAQGTLVLDPHLHFPVFPPLADMLFTLALLVGDDVLAQLTQFLFLAVLLAGCVGFARRHFSGRVGLWAAALLVGSSQVIWLSSIAYVDIGLAAYVSLGFFAFWTWRETGERSWLLLAAAQCGLAAGTKYFGLVAAALVFLFVAASSVRSRRVGDVAAFALVAGAVACPSYIRSAFLTGNPVFPFLPSLFGYSYWSAEDLRWAHDDVITTHGVGRGLWSLVTLPWHLVANQIVFDAEERISPLFGIGIPLMAVAAARWRRIGLLYGIGVAYLLAWFFSAQLLRYVVPALPVMGVAMAGALDRAFPGGAHDRALPGGTPATGHARAAVAALAGALIAVAVAAPGAWFALRKLREWGPPPTTAEARDRHITRYRPSYPAYQFLNATRGSDYTVYVYREWCMPYFADGVFLGAWVGAARYSGIEPHWDDGDSLYAALRALGATHFLISSWYDKVRVPANPAFDARFRLVYAKPNTVVFELSSAPLSRVLGANRVANAGFEALRDGWPDGWRASGRPRARAGGPDGAGRGVAVRCEGEQESVFQSVPVVPGEMCLFQYSSRSDGPTGRGQLIIVWFDESGRTLGNDFEVNAVTPEWNAYRMYVTVPPGAAFANVCASAGPGAALWFDEVFFADVSYDGAS